MAIPFLNHIDLTKSEIRRVSLHQTTTASVGTEKFTGQIIFDTGDAKAKYYDGSNWITIGDTVRTVAVDTNGDGSANNTLENSETLVLKKGSNITLSEANGVIEISATDTNTTYSAMTTSTLGLGKIRYTTGSTPAAEAQSTTSGRTYGVTKNSSNQLVVNVPWTDTNTNTQRAAGIGLSLSGNTINANVVNNATTQAPESISTTANRLYQIETDDQDNLVVNVPWSDTDTDTNTQNQYSLAVPASTTKVRLTGSGHNGATTNDVEIVGSGATTVTRTNANKLTISSTNTNTDTLQSIADSSSSSEQFVTFVANASGAQTGLSDAAFKYIPSTGTLKVTNLIVSGDTTTASETVKVIENNTLQFEGASGSNADTELNFTTATLTGGDKTVTLKNESGTVALISDLPTVNDGTLTVQGTGVLGGSGTFTANDSDSPTISITHDAVSRTNNTSTASPGYGATFTAIDSITTSSQGHVTAVNTKTVTLPASDNTDTNTQLQTKHALIDVSSMASTDRTAEITHGLSSNYVIVQMYDTTTGQIVYADVDHVSNNRVDITFSSVPTNDIRVVMIDAITGITAGSVNYS